MTLLSPNHNYAADECIAQIPQHHIPNQEEKVRASERFDKAVLVAAHMAALHDAYIMEMGTHPVNEVTIKPASPTSSIGGLKPSTLKQLKVGKVHRRRVLKGSLCSRTLCTKTFSGLTVVNVFEDEEGNATPIYLSNAMEGNGGSAQAQRYYPQDSKVAVKEPYLTRLPDGEVVLLVEKMTDLVFLWVPDYVEDSAGLNGNGMCKDEVGENFATEKGGNDCDKDVSSGSEPVMGEDSKSSNASRELKFDNPINVKGSADNDNASVIKEDVNSSCASQELKFDETLSTTRSADSFDIQVEGGDQDSKSSNASRDLKFDNPINVKGSADNDNASVIEEDVKSPCASQELKSDETLSTTRSADSFDIEAEGGDQKYISLDALARNPLAAVNGVGLEKDPDQMSRIESEGTHADETKVVENENGSRGVNIEDILFLRESDDNSHNAEVDGNAEVPKVADGEDNKVTKVDSMKERETEVGDIGESACLEVVNEGPLKGKHSRNADAGEAAASLRVKGNALFAKGEYNKAIDMYKQAAEKARLDKLEKEEVLCLSNRAEVWIRLCRNQAALDDAEAALKILRQLEGNASDGDLALAKALFRKGRALMGLHKYEDAMRVLQEVLAKAPPDRQLREAATKCRDRLQRVLKPGKRQRAAMNRRKSASFMLQ